MLLSCAGYSTIMEIIPEMPSVSVHVLRHLTVEILILPSLR